MYLGTGIIVLKFILYLYYALLLKYYVKKIVIQHNAVVESLI